MVLIPCLATALIIYLGGLYPNNNFLLTNNLSQWIGKISYPLYLWHWPIIVFCGFYLFDDNIITQTIIIFFSILLA